MGAKSKRRNRRPSNSVTDGQPLTLTRKPKRVPSELEVTAQKLHDLNEALVRARSEVSYLEAQLAHGRDVVQSIRAEHQQQVTKLQALSVPPQPKE